MLSSPPPHMPPKLNRARATRLHKISKNIASFGHHIYVVTGGTGAPHYAYTIGLSKTHGAELVLAGAYFYELDDIPRIIRSVSKKIRLPLALNGGRVELARFGTFSLTRMDATWVSKLMLGALDFYQVKEIAALQIVPDTAHWTIDVPNLSQPCTLEAAPGWRWLREPWTLPIPQNSVCLTNLDALRGERITEVMRWEEDEWEMFAGAGPRVPRKERRVVPIGVLLAHDKSLAPVLNLLVGTGLWRKGTSGWRPWQRLAQQPT